MAGLEVVVRPVVFPDIRPTRALPVAPQDDPESDVAVIEGLGGKLIDLSFSESSSWSRSKPTETKRRVDRQRIYQVNQDGTVNYENYVDVETVTSLWTMGGDGSITQTYYAKPQTKENIETLETDVMIKNPDAPSSST